MRLSVAELMLCTNIKGFGDIHGIDYERYEDTIETNVLPERLLDSGLFDETDGEKSYRFSALGEHMMSIMTSPDIWLRIDRLDDTRLIYVKDTFYLYADIDGDLIQVDYLPSIPLLIGAYADMLEKNGSDIQTVIINGVSGGKTLVMEPVADGVKDTADGSVFSGEEETVNYVTAWLINGMKDMEVREDE